MPPTAPKDKDKNKTQPPVGDPPVGDPPAGDTGEAPVGDPPAPEPKPAAKGQQFRYPVPKELEKRPGIDTLMDACEVYGINPDPRAKPIELAAWHYYPFNEDTQESGYVQLVTGGGLKIRHYDDPDHPMWPDTEERLRREFRAFSIDPKTHLPIPQPLPPDLTLPATAVDGVPRSVDHQYRGGYLQSGGKTEAARRAAERKTRPKR